MAKQTGKAIDKEAMFKKIMPSAAIPASSDDFDPLDSFGLDDDGVTQPRKPAKKKPAAQTARTRPSPAAKSLDELDLFSGGGFDPLDALDLFDETPTSTKNKAAARQKASKPAPRAKQRPEPKQTPQPLAQPDHAAPAANQQTSDAPRAKRPARSVQAVKQAGHFPIDTNVLQNPAAPTAPVPPPAPVSAPCEPAPLLAAPAAPTAPIPPPASMQSQPNPSGYDPEDADFELDGASYPTGGAVLPDPFAQQQPMQYLPPPAYPQQAPYPQQMPYPQQTAGYPAPALPYPFQPPVFYSPHLPAAMHLPSAVQEALEKIEEQEPPAPPEPTMSAEELKPVNVTALLLERQLDPIIDRLHACRCDRCKTDAAAQALSELPVHYELAGHITEEHLFDREAIQQTVFALCRAVLFVKSHPQH